MSEMKDKLLKYVSEKYHLGKLDIKESHFVDKAKFVDDIKHAVDDYHAEVDTGVDQKAYLHYVGEDAHDSLDYSIIKSFENTLNHDDMSVIKQTITSESGIKMDVVVFESDKYIKVMVHASDSIFSNIDGMKVDFADMNLMKTDLASAGRDSRHPESGDQHAFHEQFDVHVLSEMDVYGGAQGQQSHDVHSGVFLDHNGAVSTQMVADDYYYEASYYDLPGHEDLSLVHHVATVIDHA